MKAVTEHGEVVSELLMLDADVAEGRIVSWGEVSLDPGNIPF